MKHLNLFDGGIKGKGLRIRKGHFFHNALNESSSALDNVKNNISSVPVKDFNKIGLGSGVNSSVRKAIKPLKYKF